MKKLTQQEAEKVFSDNNCKLVSVYVNNGSKIQYICECGKEATGTLLNIQNGQRCMKCRKDKFRKNYQYSYEYVKSYFKEQNCILLSKEYKNNKQLLDYVCSCGTISKVSFGNFKNASTRCDKCRRVKMKKTCLEKYGTEHALQNEVIKNKMRDSNEERGNWTSIERLSNLDKYRRIVARLTYRQYRLHKDTINPLNLRRGSRSYHIDHRFSIMEGFNQDIEPEVISGYTNLQMLYWKDNLSKGNSCSISKNELMELRG